MTREALTLLDRAFSQLRKTGRGNGPPPNLTISSQMMMKPGVHILWVKIFSNW